MEAVLPTQQLFYYNLFIYYYLHNRN